MASGALMLKKEEPCGRILGKRVLRFALILIAASLFFYWGAYGRKGTMSVPDFLLHLYRNDLTGHLWYLYSYLCYLLLMIVYQAAQLLPAADYALFHGTAAHTSYISFFVAADYVVYPLLGHYIDSLTEKEEREETVCILLFLSILAVFLTSVLMDWRCGVDGGWTNAKREAYMGRLSVFPAITVFYCVRKLFARLPVKNGLANVLFILGSCTFGVYLFDPKWRQLTQSVRTLLTPSIGLYFATHVQTICACLPGLAATFLFKCVTGGAGLLAGTFDDGCESDQGAAAGYQRADEHDPRAPENRMKGCLLPDEPGQAASLLFGGRRAEGHCPLMRLVFSFR